MPAAPATDKLGSRYYLKLYDHDPDTASAQIATNDGGTTLRTLDMKDYSCFAVKCMSSTLTGAGPTLVEIVASDSSDMSTNVTQVKTSGTVAADAVGDEVFLECDASELSQLSSDNGYTPGLRYVAARVTVANSADECVIAYFAVPKYPRDGLTGNAIS